MELSIESMKQVITDNPGITNPEIEAIFDKDCHAVKRWRDRVNNTREDGTNKSWLFIQSFGRVHRYYSRSYAKQNNIPDKILAKASGTGSKPSATERQSNDDVNRMAKMWKAPKRVIT